MKPKLELDQAKGMTWGEEVFICKVKDCSLLFMTDIVKAADKYVKKHYPGYKGFMRNAADGTYELFAIKEDIKTIKA